MANETQQLKDLAFNLIVSANNIISSEDKKAVRDYVNSTDFNSKERELILNGKFGETKKILKTTINKTVSTNEFGLALIDHGITDKQVANDIIKYYKDNRFSGLGGKGIEYFNNFLDAYLPYILDESGKFSQTNIKHLKLILDVNEENKRILRESNKTAKDEAYTAWILGNDIKINGKTIHNNNGIKQLIKAINPNANVELVLKDISKLGELQAEYALLTDDGKEKFSIFSYQARKDRTKDLKKEDLSRIKELEKEISKLIEKLGPVANISLLFKNARITAVPSSIKLSKSYKEQLKVDTSNIVSEINGVEKFITEELFDALMLEGIGKILKIPVGSNISKYISEHAPEVFNIGTKISNKTKDLITKTIDWVKPVDPALAKTISLTSQVPKTILKTSSHIVGGEWQNMI